MSLRTGILLRILTARYATPKGSGTVPRACARLFPSALCSSLWVGIGFGVVLIAVDLTALLILLVLDLVVLSGRQMAAIRRAIAARFVVDGGFVFFDVRSLSSRQLTGVNSLIDAILLPILARVHAHPLRVSRSAVVHRRIVAAVNPGVVLM